jgi:hypothetical protein
VNPFPAGEPERPVIVAHRLFSEFLRKSKIIPFRWE